MQLQEELDKEQSTVGDLRRRMATIEKEKLTLITKFNQDSVALQNHATKVEADLENGKAQKYGLEYELASLKQKFSQTNKLLQEKEASTLDERNSLKDQVADLKSRLSKTETDLSKATQIYEKKETALSNAVLQKEQELGRVVQEFELTKVAKSEMEKFSETQQKQIQELERNLANIQSELSRHIDKLKLQRTESDWMLQKEKQMKAELDAAIEKTKALEANTEAERAAHLETKFNSEIVQLRIRDVEVALEEEKSLAAKRDEAVQASQRKIDELNKSLQDEKKSNSKLSNKLRTCGDELAASQKHASQQEDLINELSKEIDTHQNHFSTLKEELEKTKTNQKHLEGNYSTWLKDIEITVFNYWTTLKQRQFQEDYPPSSPSQSSSPRSLVEGVKVLLGEYVVQLQNSKTSSEIQGKLENKVTELQQTLGRREHELEEKRKRLEEVNSAVEQLQVERESVFLTIDKEKTERNHLENEYLDLTSKQKAAEEEKLQFLWSVISKLLTLIPNAPTMLELEKMGHSQSELEAHQAAAKTWSSLSVVMTENVAKVGVVIKTLRKKLKLCEEELRKEEELKRHMMDNQEETLRKMAEATATVEAKSIGEKSELEEHFSQLLQKVHERAKQSDAEAHEAHKKIHNLEADLQDSSKEILLLQSQFQQVESDRVSLVAACALLTSALYPMYARQAALASQRHLAEDIASQSTTFRRHACLLVETLASEFPSQLDEPEKESQSKSRTRAGFSGVLTFRRGALAVMASNRLRKLGLLAKSNGNKLPFELPRKGKFGSLLIGNGQATPVWSTSNRNGHDGNDVNAKLIHWLTSTDLQTGVILAVQPLVERIMLQQQGAASNLNGELPHITSIACTRLLERIKAHFSLVENGTSFISGDPGKRGGSLSWRLGHGLSRALTSVDLRPRLKLASAQEIMSSLQHHLLAITHRLHTCEVERKDLRRDNSVLTSTVGEYKSVREIADCLKNQTSQLQQELQGTVKAEQFASVCGELQATLAREQQTQKLMANQAQRIQNLSRQLDSQAKQQENREATHRQQSSQISELKKDSRKKDNENKDKTKSMDRLEKERDVLLANVRDAEKALTTVAKDKDRLHAFIKTTEKSLQQAMKHLKLLSEGGSGGDSVLPLNLGNLLSPLPHSPQDKGKDHSELKAARSLVALFVDVYQAAIVKMTSMQQELQANQQHIRRLKSELSDACARGCVASADEAQWNRKPLGYANFANPVELQAPITQVASVPHISAYHQSFQPLPPEDDSENSHVGKAFSTPNKASRLSRY